jgi:hypothetical protein
VRKIISNDRFSFLELNGVMEQWPVKYEAVKLPIFSARVASECNQFIYEIDGQFATEKRRRQLGEINGRNDGAHSSIDQVNNEPFGWFPP